MAPKLRPRTSQVKPGSYASSYEDATSSTRGTKLRNDDTVLQTRTFSSSLPAYRIDLSLPPIQRYVEVARDYHHHLHNLPHLFDDLCNSVKLPTSIMHFIARIFLRKICSREQTQELRGISEIVGLPMYLLVAYNVLLDLFMGCTSGGALVQSPDSKVPNMMHFRTLDWGMPELRDVLVQFDFVANPEGDVMASTISYVGFVGVLTGVRQGLSASINFRPYHNNDKSLASNLKFYTHQLAVLLGLRPSIASILRDFILPRTNRSDIVLAGAHGAVDIDTQPLYGQIDIYGSLLSMSTTAGYLIFCTGDETIILEKDRKTAKILKSSDFIAVTNHDVSYDVRNDANHTNTAHVAHAKNAYLGVGMEDIVEESIDRKRCLTDKWMAWPQRSSRASKVSARNALKSVPLHMLKRWMQEYPTSNEQSHFVCIMDPAKGVFRWVRRYEEGEIEDERQEEVS